MRRALLVTAALVAAALPVAGCGGGSGSSNGVVVSAASSLKGAFTAYGKGFKPGPARFSFAGSDELAAQIRQGVKPDVFASANTKLPDQLAAAGLVEKPVVFAGNRLVLAVPGNSKLRSVSDAARPGTTVAVGSPTVPIGSYTREVLGKLGRDGAAILRNVRSQEPDVKGVVGKLTQGAVDAGFVYVTDVEATDGALRAIELPRNAAPTVAYAVAVVRGAKHPAAAKRFVDGLLHGKGRDALRAAGFAPPPQEP